MAGTSADGFGSRVDDGIWSGENCSVGKTDCSQLANNSLPKITCGDIVVHPTKSWPWIGIVQPKVGDFARLCTNCGGLRVPSYIGRDANTQYKIRFENEEGPVALCESDHEDSPSANRGAGDMGIDEDCMSTDDCCHTAPIDGIRISNVATNMQAPLLALSLEGPAPSRHFQINWFFNDEATDMDGTERVILPCKQRTMFQEGSQLGRVNTNVQGLVKQVHRTVDAFVLNDCHWTITDISTNKLKPLMDVDLCPGSLVIYNGWVGTLYNVCHRLTLRTEDGLEFTLTDDQNEIISVHVQEAGRRVLCSDTYQMYAGLKLKVRWLVLEHAKWPDGFVVPDSMLAKIKASQEAWESAASANASTPFVDSGNGSGDAKEEAMFESASSAAFDHLMELTGVINVSDVLHKPVPSYVKRDIRLLTPIPSEMRMRMKNSQLESGTDDMITLTVVKVEPVRLDVEWLSQVVADSSLAPRGNLIEGDELKKCIMFRTSRVLDPYDVGTRYRYTIQEGDKFVPTEIWRRRVLGDTTCDEDITDLPPAPAVGETVYVAVMRGSSTIDVLWEDGQFESCVNLDSLVIPYSAQAERDYFPAMYVAMQSEPSAGKRSKSAAADADDSTRRFGVIKRARNAEKFAVVAWYELSSQPGDGEDKLTFINEEEVSYYDLKFNHEYNYVGGTLVSRVNASKLGPNVPNIGYVQRKNPDGSVAVVWYDGTEETTQPWTLRQLNLRYGSEYAPSDMDDEDRVYSPTEHEYEDLEDLRYYDYAGLSVEMRQKRIGLMVAVLREVIVRLSHLIALINKYFPYMDRKRLVKLTLSCNDICNGFANLSEFKDTIKTVFDCESTSSGHVSKPKLLKGRILRDERLVWQCANWLFDWTEAMTTLYDDLRKYKHKTQKKDAKNLTGGDSQDTALARPASPWKVDVEEEKRQKEENPMYALVSDLLNTVEAGLTTVTGILSVPADKDISGSVVGDFLNGIVQESSRALSTEQLATMEFATLSSSHKFLRTLIENASKAGRLPCFSYTHHSELELSALLNSWPSTPFAPAPSDGNDAETSNGCQSIVFSMGTLIDEVLHDRRDISYADDDILRLCNRTADALCLSALSIMHKILEAIYANLRAPIEQMLSDIKNEQSCKETTEMDSEPAYCNGMAHENLEEEVLDDSKCRLSNGSAMTHFDVLANAPSSQRFVSKQFDATIMPKSFLSAIRREVKLLSTSLPPGIVVKTYEDRMDLFSCMIVGPQGTPYADGLFFFDVRLKEDYPSRPPHMFYKSMSKSLNPNLYEDGMVCLSLLGTWDGKETELWTSNSTLLQVFVSVQSLILVSEPYFNEPGYEKEKGTALGATKSRDYNEAAVLRTLESLQRVLNDPPEPFQNEVRQHIVENGQRLIRSLDKYQSANGDNNDLSFPLFPVTQGFCLCIKRHSENLRLLAQKYLS